MGQGLFEIDRGVANILANLAWEADAGLLGLAPSTAVAQGAKIRNELAKLPPTTPWAEVFDVGERYEFLNRVGVAARDGFAQLTGVDDDPDYKYPARSLFAALQGARIDWDTVLRTGNPWFDRLADACRKPTRAERRMAFKAIEADFRRATATSERTWYAFAEDGPSSIQRSWAMHSRGGRYPNCGGCPLRATRIEPR